MCSTYGENPRLLPEKLMQDYKRPEKTIPRSPGIMEEWIAAIKAGKKSTTDFEYSGPAHRSHAARQRSPADERRKRPCSSGTARKCRSPTFPRPIRISTRSTGRAGRFSLRRSEEIMEIRCDVCFICAIAALRPDWRLRPFLGKPGGQGQSQPSTVGRPRQEQAAAAGGRSGAGRSSCSRSFGRSRSF